MFVQLLFCRFNRLFTRELISTSKLKKIVTLFPNYELISHNATLYSAIIFFMFRSEVEIDFKVFINCNSLK